MKKYKLWRGLTAALCVLLSLCIGLSAVAMANEGSLNLFLNIDTGAISDTGSGEMVYKSRYGELSDENLEKLKADIDVFIATEMEEGAVLLSNNGALPLASTGLNVTLFGHATYDPIYNNASAGGVLDADRMVSLKQALEGVGYNINEELYNAYANGTAVRKSEAGEGSSIGEEPISFYTQTLINSFNSYKDAAIVMFARAGGEGCDLNTVDSEGISQLALHQAERDLLTLINDSGFEKTIVILNSANPMEISELEDYGVDACLWIGTPGLTGFVGVANILNGTVSPSGKLVDTYAINSQSSPAMMNFGDYHFSNAPDLNYVIQAEGIYVGYKYYETRYEDSVMGLGNAASAAGSSTGEAWNYADEVQYAFGHGLSYTTFTQEIISCEYNADSDTYDMVVKVTNVGDHAGKDVVQVYLQSPYTDYDREHPVEKASIQLVDYAKTATLDPGASEEVTINIDRYLCASYDTNNAKGYILDAGDYFFAIGADAHDALNNVLAAKGYTVENGMTADGDESKTYLWTVAELDTESYKYSGTTGEEVTNVFIGDYAVDINDFYEEDVVTYLTRQDWEGTYPISYENLEASQALLDATVSRIYEKSPTAKSVSDFTQGVEANIDVIDVADWEWDDPRWDTFLDQMTLEELAIAINNNTGTKAIESIGKPSVRDADGPNGYAFNYTYGDKSTASCYAGQMVAASTWSKDIMRQLGEFYAEECLYCRGNETFAPGVNMHRTPYGGRNFEYFSEDSILSYHCAMIESAAMQDNGLISSPKHFAANDQELNRSGLCTFMTEQRMRQECLKAFEGALSEDKGHAGGTMGMMGRVGAKADTVCKPMLTNILRGEWGFKGSVITDAGGPENDYQPTADCLMAGVDTFCLTSRSSFLVDMINSTDDGDMLEVLREINKRYYYTRSHSNMLNRLSKDVVIEADIVPWWKTAIYAIDAVVGVVTVAAAAVFILSITGTRKKKKE